MIHYAEHHHRQSSHQVVASLVRHLRQGPVLDVGAAQGVLGRSLVGSGLEADAIEMRAEWASLSRPYYRQILVSTVEAAHLNPAVYGTVVCADVLEHLVDPVAVLRKLQLAATADARFVISLPNVAHLSARLLLLMGFFPAMDRGIFDRTHLHFYTRRTATQMLREAGLLVTQVRSTPVPLEQLWPLRTGSFWFQWLMHLQRAGLRLAPHLFSFQFIFVARVSSHRLASPGHPPRSIAHEQNLSVNGNGVGVRPE